jgi:sigma-54 specific flagellar transcriptional regulator A
VICRVFVSLCVIDADPARREAICNLLEFMDCDGIVASDYAGWREAVGESSGDVVCLLGDCGSAKALSDAVRALRQWDGRLPVYVLDEAGQQTPLDADLRAAVLGRLEQPLKYRQLSTALEKAEIFRESEAPRKGRPLELFRSLVGSSRAIREIRRLVEQVAGTDATVLILGESGTGKEVVARNIHYHSPRRDNAFVPINCGAIPADLLESELFGHEKGAFTGAISARQGRFELAEGGTLFLDEIGDMSLPMQVKLLRVLQERTFERVGSNRSQSADVRVIAATHRDLEDQIGKGAFREDLFYRLNVFPIEMPPLRERREDIPLLVNELISRIEHEKRGSIRMTHQAMMALCDYHWPGNVRELANLIERMVIMYPFRVVDESDLPEKFQSNEGRPTARSEVEQAAVPMEWLQTPRLPRGGIDLKEHLANLEYGLIKQALDEANGVVAHAAKLLNMRRTTLVEKLRKYNHSPDAQRQDVDDRVSLNS